ncbi:hypothetical protein [Streptomyces alfalfae]
MNPTMLRDLREALNQLHVYEARLNAREATPQLLRELDQGLALARRLVAAAGQLPVTLCREHPDGPVDGESGGCLLCNTRHRAPFATPPADTPMEPVLAAIEEHGPDEAARRYGPRAVARALATAGRGTTSTIPADHGQEAPDE